MNEVSFLPNLLSYLLVLSNVDGFLVSIIMIHYDTPINHSLAKHDIPVLANSVDPDQLASEEAN